MLVKSILSVVGGYGVGIWFSFLAYRKQRLFTRASWWTTTRGRVLQSELYRDPKQDNHTHFRVHYEFTARGDRIVGTTPRLCGDWFWNNRKQAAFVERFVVGEEVPVFYDSQNPMHNCLDRSDRTGIAAMWVLAVAGASIASFLVWLNFDEIQRWF